MAGVYPRSAYDRVILLAANMGGESSKCVEMGTDTTGNGYREGDFPFIPGSSFGFYLQQAVLSFLTHARIFPCTLHSWFAVNLTGPDFSCPFLALAMLQRLISFMFLLRVYWATMT